VRVGLGFPSLPWAAGALSGGERSSSRSSPSISQRLLRCLPFPGHISRVAASDRALVCAECGRVPTPYENAEGSGSWRAFERTRRAARVLLGVRGAGVRLRSSGAV
jgi:hypothetical protein